MILLDLSVCPSIGVFMVRDHKNYPPPPFFKWQIERGGGGGGGEEKKFYDLPPRRVMEEL